MHRDIALSKYVCGVEIMKQNVSRSFVVDVIFDLIVQIKGIKDIKLGEGFSTLLKNEPEKTVRRWECKFYLTSLLKHPYGISRSTKYRRLKELERAGIIEVERLGKCWIPTKEFYSDVVKLLE